MILDGELVIMAEGTVVPSLEILSGMCTEEPLVETTDMVAMNSDLYRIQARLVTTKLTHSVCKRENLTVT
jgi:hypothetical protein